MWLARAFVVGATAIVLVSGSAEPSPLLTEADVPPGWSAETVVTNADVAMPTRTLCGGPSPAARAKLAHVSTAARVTFIADAFAGPVLTEGRWRFPTPQLATTFLRGVRRAAVHCAAVAHVDRVSGVRSTVTVGAATPNPADDSFLVTQQATASTITTAGDSVYLRIGSVVLTVTLTGYVVYHGLTDHFVERALARLPRPLG